MTTNRMALVPRKVTADFLRDHGSAYAKDDWDGFIIAAPNGGKVSRQQMKAAAAAVAKHRNPYITSPQEGTKYDEYLARAVIEALGLELEE